MNSTQAELLALRALEWLARDDALLPVFVGATGTSAADLRARAGDPELLVAVLGFLTMEDAWVEAFCSAEGLAPTDPLRALRALPGGAAPDWT